MGWIYNRKEWVFARGETPVSVKLHDFGIFSFLLIYPRPGLPTALIYPPTLLLLRRV